MNMHRANEHAIEWQSNICRVDFGLNVISIFKLNNNKSNRTGAVPIQKTSMKWQIIRCRFVLFISIGNNINRSVAEKEYTRFACASISAEWAVHKRRKRITTIDKFEYSCRRCLPSSVRKISLSFNSCICKWMNLRSRMTHGHWSSFFFFSASLVCYRVAVAAFAAVPIHTRNRGKGVKFHRVSFLHFYTRTNSSAACVCECAMNISFGIDLLASRTSNPTRKKKWTIEIIGACNRFNRKCINFSCVLVSHQLLWNDVDSSFATELHAIHSVDGRHRRCRHRQRTSFIMSRQLPCNQMPSFALAHTIVLRFHFSSPSSPSVRVLFTSKRNGEIITID